MKFKNLHTGRIYFRKYFALVKNSFIIFIVAVIVFSIVYVVLCTDLLTIQTVTVSGISKFVNTQDVSTLAKNQVLGKNIFLCDTLLLEKSLENNFQGAKHFEIYRKLPNSVEITTIERTPLLLIYSDDGQLFMTDADGYILGNVLSDYINLPQLKYSGDIKVGYFIDKNLVPVFNDIKSAMDEHKLQMSSLSFSERYTHMYINSDIEVFIANSKDKKESVKIISDIFKQFKLEGKSLKKIDLRYDKVIVE